MKHTSGSRPIFEIAEETLQIDGEVLTPSDQRLKEELESGEEGRLLVDELRAGVRVTARSWVGIVRFERFEVRVVPKLAGDNIGLVEMIEFATGLDSLRRSSSARTLHAEGTGLFDLIALLLAEGTELTLAAAEILALGLSIPSVLAEVAARTQGPVSKALTQAIQQGFGDTKWAAA